MPIHTVATPCHVPPSCGLPWCKLGNGTWATGRRASPAASLALGLREIGGVGAALLVAPPCSTRTTLKKKAMCCPRSHEGSHEGALHSSSCKGPKPPPLCRLPCLREGDPCQLELKGCDCCLSQGCVQLTTAYSAAPAMTTTIPCCWLNRAASAQRHKDAGAPYCSRRPTAQKSDAGAPCCTVCLGGSHADMGKFAQASSYLTSSKGIARQQKGGARPLSYECRLLPTNHFETVCNEAPTCSSSTAARKSKPLCCSERLLRGSHSAR